MNWNLAAALVTVLDPTEPVVGPESRGGVGSEGS